MINWTEFDPAAFAYNLGHNAVNNVGEHLRLVCAHEKRRVYKANEPEIGAITFRLEFLKREWRELRVRLQLLPRTPLALLQRRRFYLAIAVVLSFAALIAAHFSMSPFGLGWEAWIFSLGLCIIGGFWTDAILERYDATPIIQFTFIAALLASLAGLIIMAVLRGDIVALYLQNSIASAGTNPDSSSGITAEAVRFYTGAARKLQWFFALLTVAMELGIGLAISEVRKTVVGSRAEAEGIGERIRAIELETTELVWRLAFLRNQPDVFEEEFLRNAYIGLLDAAQQRGLGSVGRFAVLLVFLAALPYISSAQSLRVVIGHDLSISEKSTNYTSGNEHEKNVESAAQLISHLPPGSEVSFVGITDASFSRPFILVSGQVPRDRGPLEFIDEIQIARNRLATQVRKTVQSVPPRFQTTDVLGFLVLASQMLRDVPHSRRVLVIYSDLRNSASPVNIENTKLVPLSSTLRTVEGHHLLADLHGVDVYIYGVHAIGKDIPYWVSLRGFYTAYFRASGANLRVFSMLRDIPDFNQVP